MTLSSQIGPGFAFTVQTLNETTWFIINVFGNDEVGMPLARNMSVIDDAYLDYYGIENLVIPISVSEAKEIKSNDGSYVVDVVVHSKITSRCCNSKHPLHSKLVVDMMKLAIEWVQQECGVQLVLSSCKLLGLPMYFNSSNYKTNNYNNNENNNNSSSDASCITDCVMEELTKMVKNTCLDKLPSQKEHDVTLPPDLILASRSKEHTSSNLVESLHNQSVNANNNNCNESTSKRCSNSNYSNNNNNNNDNNVQETNKQTSLQETERRVMVQEVIAPLRLKKGFLNESSKSLYGSQGSSEGSGKTYDSLAHLPQSLRERCKIVDLRPRVERESNTLQSNKDQGAQFASNTLTSTHTSNAAQSNENRKMKRDKGHSADCSNEEKHICEVLSSSINTSDLSESSPLSISSTRETKSITENINNNIDIKNISDINSNTCNEKSRRNSNGHINTVCNSNNDESLKTNTRLKNDNIDNEDSNTKESSSGWKLLSVNEKHGHCTIRLGAPEHVQTLAQISLLVNSMSLDIEHFHYPFDKPIDVSKVRAKFIKKDKILKISYELENGEHIMEWRPQLSSHNTNLTK